MELKKCAGCEKVFYGHRTLKLCPICTVAEKGKKVVERRPSDHPLDRVSVAPVTVAS